MGECGLCESYSKDFIRSKWVSVDCLGVAVRTI